jgi:hypothetical protein
MVTVLPFKVTAIAKILTAVEMYWKLLIPVLSLLQVLCQANLLTPPLGPSK